MRKHRRTLIRRECQEHDWANFGPRITYYCLEEAAGEPSKQEDSLRRPPSPFDEADGVDADEADGVVYNVLFGIRQ